MRGLRIRAVIYPLIVIPVLALAVFALMLCVRAGEAPSFVVKSRAAAWLANRVGIQLSLNSLRVGCFQPDCRIQVDAGGLAIGIADIQDLQIDLDSIHWCRVHPISIKGLRVRGASLAEISIGDLEFSTVTKTADVRDIRVARDEGSPVTVERVTSSPAILSPDDRRLTFERIDIAGITADVGGGPRPATICEQTQTMFGAGDDMATLADSTRAWLDRSIDRIRRDILYVTLIVAGLLFGLKLLAAAWMKWGMRLLLAAICVAAPFLVYVLLHGNLGTRSLIAVAFGVSLSIAVAAWVHYYRFAEHRYQRWEPVAVDIACFLIVLPLIAYNVDLTPRIEGPANVSVGELHVADSSFNATASTCGQEQTIQARIANMAVRNIDVQLPDPVERQTVAKIASVDVPGIEAVIPGVELSGLSAAVDNILFRLDGKARRIGDLRARFRAKGGVRPGSSDSIQFSASGGSVDLDPETCDFKYATAVEVTTKPVGAAASIAGDSREVRLRNIRTSAGSVVRITDGSGKVSFAEEILATLRLSGISGAINATQVRSASTIIQAKAPPLCSTGGQSFTVALNDTRLNGESGWAASIARSDIHFSRQVSGQIASRVTLANSRFAVPSSEIQGNLPSLQFVISGRTQGDPIPRNFRGDVRFSADSDAGVILGHSSPLAVSADFDERRFTIPLQKQVFQQTAIADAPREIPLSLSLNGRGDELDAFVGIPRLSLPLGSLTAELNDLEVRSTAAGMGFKSGWNRLTLPSTPSSFCLEEISRFDLTSSGAARGFARPNFNSDTMGSFPCADLPNLPGEEEFRFSGTRNGVPGEPALTVERRAGESIRIGGLNSALRRLDLTDGRLHHIELESETTGVQVSGISGESSSKTRIALTEDSARISSILTASNSDIFEWALSATPGRVQFNGHDRNRLNRISADGWLERGELARLNVTLNLGPRSLPPIGGFNISTGASAIKVNLEKDRLIVNADLARIAFAGDGSAGGALNGSADVRAEVLGRFYRNVKPAANPVAGMTSRAARNFGELLRRASSEASAPSSGDLSWNVRLSNSGDAEPFLRFNRDQISLRLGAGINDLIAGNWKITGKAGLDGDLRIHDGLLVVDAFAPIQMTASRNAAAATAINVNLPLLAVLSDRLNAAQNPDALWDADYYSRFWSGYQIRQAGRGSIFLVDETRRVAGPLSIRELVAPLQTLRVAIGHSGTLGIHAPISARLLHGSASGFVDARVGWPSAAGMTLESRLNLSLRNLQAGAIGLNVDAGHLPLLDHELDGDISLRTEGWPLTLDGASFAVDLRTSSRNESVPGVFRVQTGTQIRTLNEILDRVIKDVQLKIPPSSVFFRNLALSLTVDKGKVRTDKPWLRLEGFRILSTDDVNLEGNIRLHGARNGETVDLRNLLGNFQRAPRE